MKLLIIFFIVILSVSFNAYGNECKVNGCGSNWNKILVPDKVKALGVNFRRSCNNHDRCYSKCITNCDGQERRYLCGLEETKKIKNDCDKAFLNEMKLDCFIADESIHPLCRSVASMYYIAVQTAGSFSIRTRKDKTLFAQQLEKGKNEIKNGLKVISEIVQKNLNPKEELSNDWFPSEPIKAEYVDWFGMDEEVKKEQEDFSKWLSAEPRKTEHADLMATETTDNRFSQWIGEPAPQRKASDDWGDYYNNLENSEEPVDYYPDLQ